MYLTLSHPLSPSLTLPLALFLSRPLSLAHFSPPSPQYVSSLSSLFFTTPAARHLDAADAGPLYVCLICMPYMYALHECLICYTPAARHLDAADAGPLYG